MSEDQTRAEFEKWARSRNADVTRDGDTYMMLRARLYWEAWQAAHASGVVAGLERAAGICEQAEHEIGSMYEAMTFNYPEAIRSEISRLKSTPAHPGAAESDETDHGNAVTAGDDENAKLGVV